MATAKQNKTPLAAWLALGTVMVFFLFWVW
jgi:hypothetical protein